MQAMDSSSHSEQRSGAAESQADHAESGGQTAPIAVRMRPAPGGLALVGVPALVSACMTATVAVARAIEP